MSRSQGTVGIVVIGRNEAPSLAVCLRSVAGYPLIYVDSGSSDASVAIAREHGAMVVQLDGSKPFSAARARNAGFLELNNRIPKIALVQFMDGDCELIDGWLENSMSFLLANSEVGVVCGRRRERYPERSPYNRMCDAEWDGPGGNAKSCGGDALYRAEALDGIGLFRESLIAGEEPELCIRLRRAGWLVWRLDRDMTWHDAAMMKFGQWWRRMVRGGFAYAARAALHKDPRHPILNREMSRVVFWAVCLPCLVLVLLPSSVWALAGLLAYPMQVGRIAIRCGARQPFSWLYGMFMMLAKFAELEGIARYHFSRLFRKPQRIIEYKTPA